ncbi:MAG TPA: thioredoxin family protein [Thermoanaerobaculia bacterium]|jgi:protein disulfide-isomerase|nr:thioredoxin family protein [Thermoanaerobaculia bacterium]
MEVPRFQEDARSAIEAARKQAAREGKRVAVVFGADWCPDCDAFKSALRHRLVTPILEPSFVVVTVSVGNRNRNLDVMARYGMGVETGIPAVAIVEPDGSLVAAQREGEFRNASSLLSVAEIVSFFHRWAPQPPAAD